MTKQTEPGWLTHLAAIVQALAALVTAIAALILLFR
jgi:hypothetical protein